VAGLIGTTLLVFPAPYIVRFAVRIGAADYFAIMVLAFVAVTAVLGASRIRGFASLAIGLTIGLIGLDPQTGQQRLTFGIPQLADGIDVVVVAVAIFAIGEALWVAAHLRRRLDREPAGPVHPGGVQCGAQIVHRGVGPAQSMPARPRGAQRGRAPAGQVAAVRGGVGMAVIAVGVVLATLDTALHQAPTAVGSVRAGWAA